VIKIVPLFENQGWNQVVVVFIQLERKHDEFFHFHFRNRFFDCDHIRFNQELPHQFLENGSQLDLRQKLQIGCNFNIFFQRMVFFISVIKILE